MKHLLQKLPKKILTLIKEIGFEAKSRGVVAYLVGGFVRDLILERENLDLDIVVEGDGISFAKAFARKKNADITVYGKFGTATIVLPSGKNIDFATARKETYWHSGALPDVEPSVIYDDLFRRDFSINAIAMAINPGQFGKVVDYFNGLRDIAKKKIRVLHEKSFQDDPTRILRAIRFEQRLDFQLEKQTEKLLRNSAEQKVVQNVKPQRYFEEFKKMLKEFHPVKPLRRLNQLNGFQFLGNSFKIRASQFLLLSAVEKEVAYFAREFSGKRSIDPWIIYFMSIVDVVPAKTLKKILAPFNLSSVDQARIYSACYADRVIEQLSKTKLKPSAVYEILKPLSIETTIFIKAKSGKKVIRQRIHRFLSKDSFASLHLRGDDLKSLGTAPGQPVGAALKKLLAARIDGTLKSKQDEILFIKKLNQSNVRG
ncbi:MAG: CCA tRNA nucleotidyltransferase [Candidatus Omnitrophota bacterium]